MYPPAPPHAAGSGQPPCPLGPCRAGLGALLAGATRIVVGVSGGPDSQALLHLLAQTRASLGLALWAVGVDHGLRPGAADELQVAQQLALRLGVPFIGCRVQVATSGNVLAQARRARYRALTRVAREVGAQRLAVGHILDDQAETLLFHLVRGTGPRGAAAIAPVRRNLVRPLLGASRAQVYAYLELHAVPWAQDPSNANPARMRGLLRQQVAPALTAINERWREHLAAFCALARTENAYMHGRASKVWARARLEGHGLDMALLRRSHPALWPRVFALWLRPLRAQLDAKAIFRLTCAVRALEGPLPQGALKGVHVSRRGDALWAQLASNLPPRRAGTRPA